MLNNISANDLKVKGVSILESITSDNNEAIITVRGKSKFVVMTIDEYNRLRECELEAAIMDSKREIAEGKYNSGSINDHIERIKN